MSVDPAFAPDETAAILAGVERWAAAIPELRLTTTVAACQTPAPDEVCLHPAHQPPDPADDVVGSTYPGSADDSTVLIYVDRIRATGWDFGILTEQTTAHEIGHAIGLRHSHPGTLMAADVPDQAHTVTADDVAQFWAVRGK